MIEIIATIVVVWFSIALIAFVFRGIGYFFSVHLPNELHGRSKIKHTKAEKIVGFIVFGSFYLIIAEMMLCGIIYLVKN